MTKVTQTENFVLLDTGRLGVMQLAHITVKPRIPRGMQWLGIDSPELDMIMFKQDDQTMAIPVNDVDDFIQALQIARNKHPVNLNDIMGGNQNDV